MRNHETQLLIFIFGIKYQYDWINHFKLILSYKPKKAERMFVCFKMLLWMHNTPGSTLLRYLNFFKIKIYFYLFFLFYFLYCSGFCHTLKWNSHGFTCVPHPDPPSHLPLHPIPLGLPSAPGPSACLMHSTWAGDLFHPR